MTAQEEWSKMRAILDSVEHTPWQHRMIKLEFAARLSRLATALYIQAAITDRSLDIYNPIKNLKKEQT